MKISIIIPTYNNLLNLQKCICSIKNQTFKDFEVWIIDGDSKDGTKEYLTTLKKPFHFVSEPDNGIYDAMNKGILLSKGEWLFFLGANDQLRKDIVLKGIAKELGENVEVVSGKIQYAVKKEDSYFLKKNKGVFTSTWSNMLWIKNTVHHQATFYKKELFSKNKFNTKYKILADYAFNLELYVMGIAIKEVSQIIALCDTNGVSKKYTWSLYKEEIELKRRMSSLIFSPLFFMIGLLKYLLKKR